MLLGKIVVCGEIAAALLVALWEGWYFGWRLRVVHGGCGECGDAEHT